MKLETEQDQQKFWLRIIIGAVVGVFLSSTVVIWMCINGFQKAQNDEYNRLPIAGVGPFFMASFDPSKQDRMAIALRKLSAYKSSTKYTKKQLEELETELRDAIDVFNEIAGSENTYAAMGYDRLSTVCVAEHKWKEADEAAAKAVQLNEKLYGKQNKMTMRALTELASVKSHRKMYDEAYALYERSYKTYAKYEPPNAEATIYAVEYMGNVRSDQGKYAQAVPLYTQALAMYETKPKQFAGDIRRMHEWLGYLALKQEQVPEASKQYHEAIDAAVRHGNVAKAADIQYDFGESLARRELYKEAEQEFLHAEELARKQTPRNDKLIADVAEWKSILSARGRAGLVLPKQAGK